MFVSMISTPFIIAERAEANPYPGVECEWKSTGMLNSSLNRRIILPANEGEANPAISFSEIISAPKASSFLAMSTK